MVAVDDILLRLDDQLLDAGRVRWPSAERRRYMVDALREISIHKPEAMTVTTSITLTANAVRQDVPSGYLRLTEIVRNAGGDQEPVTAVDRQEMDLYRPGWTKDRPAAAIRHFMVDERDQRVFWVWPTPNAAIDVVAILVAEAPQTIAEGAQIAVDSVYANAIGDYVMYCCFAKDSEDAFNAQRALTHYQAFAAALGLSRSADRALSPVPGSA